MAARTALSCLGICACVLTLACANAAAAVQEGNAPAASNASVLAEPAPAVHAPTSVVVADPRNPSIRIELPAAELLAPDESMDRLYRKLVKSSKLASANTVVAENGRIFFRRTENSAVARAAEIAPMAQGLLP